MNSYQTDTIHNFGRVNAWISHQIHLPVRLRSRKKDPGGLPERPMGGDCKSPGSAFEGSNPSPATSKKVRTSALWNVMCVDDGYDPKYLEIFEQLVSKVR